MHSTKALVSISLATVLQAQYSLAAESSMQARLSPLSASIGQLVPDLKGIWTATYQFTEPSMVAGHASAIDARALPKRTTRMRSSYRTFLVSK